MKWFLKALKSYATFKGRARRKEYWMFSLFNAIFLILIAIIDGLMGAMMILYCLYALATLLPTLAVTVRRLHDTGRSGWWFLIILLPIVGGIWLFVLMCLDSQPGDNKYGPNPKAGEVFAA